jgi:hypothetical protein
VSEPSRLMRIYLLLEEERSECAERDDAGPWPDMIADWQDAVWIRLSERR